MISSQHHLLHLRTLPSWHFAITSRLPTLILYIETTSSNHLHQLVTCHTPFSQSSKHPTIPSPSPCSLSFSPCPSHSHKILHPKFLKDASFSLPPLFMKLPFSQERRIQRIRSAYAGAAGISQIWIAPNMDNVTEALSRQY